MPPEEIQDEAKAVIQREQNRYKKQYDKKRYVGVHYDVGEVVVVKAAAVATGHSTKLQKKYKGPFTVIKVLPSDTYLLEKINCGEGQRKITTTAHVSQLKGYYNPNKSEDDDSEEGEIQEDLKEIMGAGMTDNPEERKLEEGKEKRQVAEEDEEHDAGRPVRKRQFPTRLRDYHCC